MALRLRTPRMTPRIPHPASRIPHPASRIPHPASRIPPSPAKPKLRALRGGGARRIARPRTAPSP
ncbi:hypothetical protein [Solimonas flava]|uniref:hypothetical protein n=1 Tax=Solimonas flava TaxID=415849 RepID=UPI00040AEC91|nr:hypothetical protein [Solimonas flava]